MNLVNRLAALGVLTLVLLAGGAGRVRAADNHYALVGIDNPTNLTITYSFKWGEDGAWKTYVLEPGERRWHAWAYAYANENRSPRPYIRFDCDLSSDINMTEYRLTAYAAPVKQYRYANEYAFRRTGGGYLLDLFPE
jgi:hypothetical protein